MHHNFHQQHKGAALLIFILFFLAASLGLTFLLSKTIYQDLQALRTLADSKQSYFVAESGVEDVVYRFVTSGVSVDTTETLTLAGATAVTDSTLNASLGQLSINGIGNDDSAVRKITATLLVGSGASFNFGVQTGNGGFTMANNTKVVGNVFSNGDIVGSGSSEIEGDVIAAGPGGTVDNIVATGTIWADNILNSTVGTNMDAFYGTTFTNNSYSGTVFGPGWPLEDPTTLPIPDDVVAAHQGSTTDAIAAGDGTLIASTDTECLSGEYVVDSDFTFSGPYKIECDVLFDKNNTDITLTDTLWVEGTLTVKNATVIADPATTTDSILVIADDASDRTTGSQIILNGANFRAETSPKSYVVLLSMNESAEVGGTETAIDIGNSTGVNYDDFLAYAGHGKIILGNQVDLKEITGYQIQMAQNTEVYYESGLLNLNFTSGPGGGFEFDTWGEVE